MKAMLNHKKLRASLAQLNLTQEKLAGVLDISERYAGTLCRQDVNVSVTTYMKICRVLHAEGLELLLVVEDTE